MTLALLLVLMLVVTVAATLLLTAWSFLHPPRMTDGKAVYVLKRLSPSDLGLSWEDQDFVVRDQRSGRPIKIAGWWIPRAGADRTVIFLHGYADAKVGSIAWAPTWHALGWNILAIDLRAHGQSGGKCISGGAFESADVDQVINQLRSSRPRQTERLAILGISYGSAVALGVGEKRDDIDAIVLECPIACFRWAVRRHAELLELPLPKLMPLALRLAEWICGASFDAVEPIRAIRAFPRRLMIIAAEDDPFVTPAQLAELKQAAASRPTAAAPTVFWQVAGITHLMALPADAHEYSRRLGEFLQGV